ncbi:hypothetical protein ACWDYH_08855 [Nocardia goodfellowii]
MGEPDQQLAQADVVREALAIARGTASSLNDMVTVEVGADGTFHSIQLSEQGSRLSASQLVEIILEIHKVGLARAAAVLEDAVAQVDDVDDANVGVDAEASGPVADQAATSKAAPEAVAEHPLWPTIRPYRHPEEDEEELSEEHALAEDSYGAMEHVIQPYQPPENDSFFARVLPGPPPSRRFPSAARPEVMHDSASQHAGGKSQQGGPESPADPAAGGLEQSRAVDWQASQIRANEDIFSMYESPWDDWDYGLR